MHEVGRNARHPGGDSIGAVCDYKRVAPVGISTGLNGYMIAAAFNATEGLPLPEIHTRVDRLLCQEGIQVAALRHIRDGAARRAGEFEPATP